MENNVELLFEIKEMRSLLKVMDKRLESIEQECRRPKKSTNEEICADNIWDSAKNIIEIELTEVSFNTWLKPIEEFKIEDDIVYLKVCNEFTKSILEARYMELIESAIYQVANRHYKIEFVLEKKIISKVETRTVEK